MKTNIEKAIEKRNNKTVTIGDVEKISDYFHKKRMKAIDNGSMIASSVYYEILSELQKLSNKGKCSNNLLSQIEYLQDENENLKNTLANEGIFFISKKDQINFKNK